MSFVTKIVSAVTLIAGLAAFPATSGDFTPVGSWQDAAGTTRFKVTFCGKNHEICAQLVHLAGAARTPENLKYLNDYVFKNARRAAGFSWKGEAKYLGESVTGTLTLVDGDTITINGCKGILCEKFQLIRV